MVIGMVHVSNIVTGRISSPSEVVKRNDRVKVKVMSIAGNKNGLSMKDVDQQTGEDLRCVLYRNYHDFT
jgi:ATP-dependent RNA helicase DHX8/PRP22